MRRQIPIGKLPHEEATANVVKTQKLHHIINIKTDSGIKNSKVPFNPTKKLAQT